MIEKPPFILFFNTRIDSSKESAFHSESWGILPVMYPRTFTTKDDVDKFEILKHTIKSYSYVDFDFLFFNIEVDNTYLQRDLANHISDLFPTAKFDLKFTRPNTFERWKTEVDGLIQRWGSNAICFVAMNHDHCFLLASDCILSSIIDDAFFSKNAPSADLIIYSHTPEMLSKVFNSKSRVTIRAYGYILHDSHCTESIVICNLSILSVLFDQINNGPRDKYIPRIDWPTLEYTPRKFDVYVPATELFRHYDSYGHISLMGLPPPIAISTAEPAHTREFSSLADDWWKLNSLSIRDRLPLFFGEFLVAKAFASILNQSLQGYINCSSLGLRETQDTSGAVQAVHKPPDYHSDRSFYLRSEICATASRYLPLVVFDGKVRRSQILGVTAKQLIRWVLLSPKIVLLKTLNFINRLTSST